MTHCDKHRIYHYESENLNPRCPMCEMEEKQAGSDAEIEKLRRDARKELIPAGEKVPIKGDVKS